MPEPLNYAELHNALEELLQTGTTPFSQILDALLDILDYQYAQAAAAAKALETLQMAYSGPRLARDKLARMHDSLADFRRDFRKIERGET